MTKEQKKKYEDTEILREIIKTLKGRKFKLDCGHYAENIVMRSPRRADSVICYRRFFLLCIKVRVSSTAINSSVALKRPERSLGGTTDSSASSFTEGSTRVYISVVCIFACPSQRETFRKSLVASRTVKAQVWRSTCGEMRFPDKDGQHFAAMRACLSKMYSKPERVIGSPRAFKNSSGMEVVPLTANQDRSTAVVSFHRGKQRCFRPLPWTIILAGCLTFRLSTRSPIYSETRNPPAKQR